MKKYEYEKDLILSTIRHYPDAHKYFVELCNAIEKLDKIENELRNIHMDTISRRKLLNIINE